MAKIYSYTKYVDSQISRTLSLPEGADHHPVGTELATIDGITYVSIPDTAILPANQADEIQASVTLVTLTPALIAAIKASSPHVKLISERMIEQIRAAYTIDDEMYFARIGIGKSNGLYTPTADELTELSAFGVFVEGVRQWGRDQRAQLGL